MVYNNHVTRWHIAPTCGGGAEDEEGRGGARQVGHNNDFQVWCASTQGIPASPMIRWYDSRNFFTRAHDGSWSPPTAMPPAPMVRKEVWRLPAQFECRMPSRSAVLSDHLWMGALHRGT